MIPVLEYDVGGNCSQMLEEPVCGATGDDSLAPCQDRERGGGMERKGEYIAHDEDAGQCLLPCPKLCSRLYPLVLSTLKVSFSIFQRARPHAAISATLPALTSRSVTKLL